MNSPTLHQLQNDLAAGKRHALEIFWQRISEQGTPLVEVIRDDETHVLVTLLWKDQGDTHNVAVIGQLDNNDSNLSNNRMSQLPNSDVWYKTYHLPSDLRTAYFLSPNDSLIPFHQVTNWQERTSTWQHDPFNPHTLKVPEHQHARLSVIELPSAPPQPWVKRRPDPPTGKVTEARISSGILGNERTIWIYIPPGYAVNSEHCNLLLLFDGWAYIDVIHAPTTLDNLLADKKIPAFVVVFVDIINFAVRSQELSCSPQFADFVAKELLPWIEENYQITSDPAHRIVGGFSLGGLAAAYFGLKHSNAIGNVLAQSGSFWWRPDSAHEHEWLTRQFAIAATLPLHFHLDVGLLETDATFGDGPNMIVVNRHMRDVLQAKGYPIHYSEYSGGHDYLYWRGALADGLIALTQGAKAER